MGATEGENMAYDITSGETGAVRYPATMDQVIIDESAAMAALENASQIRAFFLTTRDRLPAGDDPWAGAFGRLQSDVRALLGIIDRQRDEIASLSVLPLETADDDEITVAMVCTACRKPVSKTLGRGTWVHENTDDYLACPVPDGTPVKAMVAAGNESVPRG